MRQCHPPGGGSDLTHTHSQDRQDKGRREGGREIYSTLSLASCSPAVSQAFLKAAGSKSVSPNKGFPRKAFDLSHLTQTIDGKDGRVTPWTTRGVRRPIKGGPGPLLGNGGRGRGRFGGQGGEGLIDQAEVDSAVDGTTGISTRARTWCSDRQTEQRTSRRMRYFRRSSSQFLLVRNSVRGTLFFRRFLSGSATAVVLHRLHADLESSLIQRAMRERRTTRKGIVTALTVESPWWQSLEERRNEC